MAVRGVWFQRSDEKLSSLYTLRRKKMWVGGGWGWESKTLGRGIYLFLACSLYANWVHFIHFKKVSFLLPLTYFFNLFSIMKQLNIHPTTTTSTSLTHKYHSGHITFHPPKCHNHVYPQCVMHRSEHQVSTMPFDTHGPPTLSKSTGHRTDLISGEPGSEVWKRACISGLNVLLS